MGRRARRTSADSWRSLKLWRHQTEAVELIEEYLRARQDKSALIHMPTGTGKTGVIAVLSRVLDSVGGVLVLTPWRILRDQLRVDLESAFWRKIGAHADRWPKRIVSFLPSTLTQTLESCDGYGTVFIGTIQALRWLKANQTSLYDGLQRSISLVIVDEGHYEPAPDWADAVRGLGQPTVLLTATPYRNDLKLFDVDLDYIYTYAYQEAVRERLIRDVAVREIGTSDADSFVEELLVFFRGEFQDLKPSVVPSPRVIIRCESFNSVNDVASLLASRGESVVAIHERFPASSSDFRRRTVPDPRSSDYTFWVHQYKLMEGVDNPDFVLLAIYEPLRNARSLVQQVGRVVRNPSRRARQSAYLLADPLSRQTEYWGNYVEFERAASDRGYYVSIAEQPIQERLLEAQRDILYIEGNFRSPLDPTDPSLEDEVLFRMSTNVYSVDEEFNTEALAASYREEAVRRDCEVLFEKETDVDTRFYLYLVCRNTPVLRSKAFVECDLGYALFRRNGSLLFHYDSQSMVPEYLATHGKSVDPSDLQRLFPDVGGSRLVEVSLLNADVGRHTVRGRTIRARALDDTPPSIGDHLYFCSTAAGYSEASYETPVRRYVGFGRGRITDQSLPRSSYKDYVEWLDFIATQLRRAQQKPVRTFGRFAEYADEPRHTEPVNILLDIEDVREHYETSLAQNGRREILEVEDTCCEVKDGRFAIVANGKQYRVSASYVRESGRYFLSSDELAVDYVSDELQENLVKYLNRTQSFRVVPRSEGYIFAHSQWYRPRLAITRGRREGRLDFLRLFESIAALADVSSEKGSECKADGAGWEDSSLFGLIDARGRGTELENMLSGIDVFVCDDMGTEVADFLAADTQKRHVIFIHAKAFQIERRRSASAFQEVCGQAVKNLEFLQPYSDRSPPNLRLWNRSWRAPGVGGEVSRRIRSNHSSSREVWETLRSVIRDPSSTREVWLLLGHGFSAGDLESRLDEGEAKPEDIQVVYLLQSTWNAVTSIGAQLRIFCSP